MIIRALIGNIWSGTRLALFFPVRRSEFIPNGEQAVLLLILGLLGSLSVGLFTDEPITDEIIFGRALTPAYILSFLLGIAVVVRIERLPSFFSTTIVMVTSTWPILYVAMIALGPLTERGTDNSATRFDGALANVELPAAFAALTFLIWSIVAAARSLKLAFNVRVRRAMFLTLILSVIQLLPANLWLARSHWQDQIGMVEIASSTTKLAKTKEKLDPPVSYYDIESVYYRQQPKIWDRIDDLQTQREGVVDLYFIGFAGWSKQDVFKNEVRHVQELFDNRFHTRGRSFLYINSPDTLSEVPIASRRGLDWGLYWLSDVMDVEEDILFLYLTSHGSKKSLGITLPKMPMNNIRPWQLRDMLDRSGIKWRIIVISACYSGTFIEELRDDHTLIITAAHQEKKSFGCADGREYTYFGRAYFDEALRRNWSFIDAFPVALNAVTEREEANGYDPSRPQISIGVKIRDKLSRLEARIKADAGTVEPTRGINQ